MISFLLGAATGFLIAVLGFISLFGDNKKDIRKK